MRHVRPAPVASNVKANGKSSLRFAYSTPTLALGVGLALIFAACATAEDVEDEAFELAEQNYNGQSGGGGNTAAAPKPPAMNPAMNPGKPAMTMATTPKPAATMAAPKPTMTMKPAAPGTPTPTAKPTATQKPATTPVVPTAGGMSAVGAGMGV